MFRIHVYFEQLSTKNLICSKIGILSDLNFKPLESYLYRKSTTNFIRGNSLRVAIFKIFGLLEAVSPILAKIWKIGDQLSTAQTFPYKVSNFQTIA